MTKISIRRRPPFEGAAARRHLRVTAGLLGKAHFYSRLIRRTTLPAAAMRATAAGVDSMAVAM